MEIDRQVKNQSESPPAAVVGSETTNSVELEGQGHCSSSGTRVRAEREAAGRGLRCVGGVGLLAFALLSICCSGATAPRGHAADVRPSDAQSPSIAARASRDRAASGIVIDDALAALRAFEEERRERFDWTEPLKLGADPYRIVKLDQERLVGVLRGTSELVVLDRELNVIDRAMAPRLTSALVATRDHTLFSAGELGRGIYRYDVEGKLELAQVIEIPGVASLRSLAAGPGNTLYAVSRDSRQLFLIEEAGSTEPKVLAFPLLAHGPERVLYEEGYVIVNCLLGHELMILPVGEDGHPRGEARRIVHDGPFWAVAAASSAGRLIVAATGVEDHPLDRTIGSFGYIDSFLYLYELAPSGIEKRGAFNTSQYGVVVPKALELELGAEGARVFVAAYGSARALTVSFDEHLKLLAVEATAMPPGSAELVRVSSTLRVAANPLLDAWVRKEASYEPAVVAAGIQDERSALEKLGEALLFTTLMTPWSRARGALSRFTCETCHFEGDVDGRTHWTGRGHVRATTKPLHGLLNRRRVGAESKHQLPSGIRVMASVSFVLGCTRLATDRYKGTLCSTMRPCRELWAC